MSNERKDTTGGMDPADDEALWRLLGQARGPEVSPYFSRRVLREMSLAGEKGRASGWLGGWLMGLRGTWRRPRAAVWPGAVFVAVFWLSVVVATNTPSPSGAGRPARRDGSPLAGGSASRLVPALSSADGGDGVDAAVADADGVAPQDVEVIADLDDMISREESRLWTDDTARF